MHERLLCSHLLLNKTFVSCIIATSLFGAGFVAFAENSSVALSLNKTSLEIHVGDVTRLRMESGKANDDIRWESTAPGIAEVFQNGFVIGLATGEARIRALEGASSAECAIKISPEPISLRDPATLKQFPDNRKFTVDGRKCYGSELNGQRASDPNEHRFTRANRVINPKPLRADQPLEWELRPGTEVYDGAGVLMGTVPPTLEAGGRRVPVSKFNFGASKILHGRMCVYAFSVSISPSPTMAKLISPNEMRDGRVATSAWLPLDDVVEKEKLLERIGLGRARLPALPLEETGYAVTGGNPQMYFTSGGELGIVRQVDGPVPSHYLRRPSGTINLIYSVPGFGLGGQGVDSFLVSDGLIFYPAKGAKVFVQPTYYPSKDPRSGKASHQTMTFIYGAIEGNGFEPVYGWIAKEALGQPSSKPLP